MDETKAVRTLEIAVKLKRKKAVQRYEYEDLGFIIFFWPQRYRL